MGDHLGFPTSSLHLRHGRRNHINYLANLMVDEGRVTGGEFSPIICEFIDVFSEDFPGLPPICDIEVTIYLVPSTSPTSIPRYRMAPAELKELNT